MNKPYKFKQISVPVISESAAPHSKMLNSTLEWMNSELDKYIGVTKEVPWFYNERAVLGFFISGLIRNSDAIVLQEFSCFKNANQKDKKSLGRADLYFNLESVDYLVESKWCWTSVNERLGMEAALHWAREALNQACYYNKDAKVRKRNIFSLCFEAVAFAKTIFRDKKAECLKLWQIDHCNALGGLDFYSLIEVTTNVKNIWHFYDNLYFPAIAVYGVFN